MDNVIIGKIRCQSSEKGNLYFLEFIKDLTFDVKRLYFINSVNAGNARGFHAHKSLEQVLICVSGRIQINLDNGFMQKVIILDSSNNYLFIGPMIWRTMKWLVDDSVLVVLASENYDESDYIRDYDKFLRTVANEKNSI